MVSIKAKRPENKGNSLQMIVDNNNRASTTDKTSRRKNFIKEEISCE